MSDPRIVVVTGGAAGIGLGISRAFAANGDHVVLVDVDEAALRQTQRAFAAEGFSTSTSCTDVSAPDQIDSLFARLEQDHGRLDVLVNNAGILVQKPVEATTLAEWNKILAVNLTGTFLMCRAAKPLMIKSGGGQIVNIASVGGHATGRGFSAYGASKSAVLGLTRSLAVEWGEDGIRVNSVSPGGVESAMSVQSRAVDPETFDRRVARVPLGRLGQSDDIAQAVLFLADDRSSYISGIDIKVDGAIMAVHPGYS